MIGNERKVHIARCNQAGCSKVEPVLSREPFRFQVGGDLLKILGMRIYKSGYQQYGKGQKGRNQENSESFPVAPVQVEDEADDQRSYHRAGLIQRLVQAEAPTVSYLFGGVGKHGVARRIPNCLAGSFENDESCGALPQSG